MRAPELHEQRVDLNLGQGAPDTDGPPEVKEAAIRAIAEGRGPSADTASNSGTVDGGGGWND